MTTDDCAVRTAEVFGHRASIVPLEVAQPGDEQVAVPMLVGSTRGTGIQDGEGREIGVPVEAPDAPWVSLDVLSGDLSSVESVVVSGRVFASRSLPNVKELIVLDGKVAPETWKHLECLERLGVNSTAAVDIRQVSTTLQQLVVTWRVESPQSWFDDLPRLENLRRLVLLPYVGASLAPLARLPSLRELRFVGGKHLSSLGRLELLERVEMREVKLESLKAFRGWTRVRNLYVDAIKNLDGIETLGSLEDLSLYGRKLPEDLTPLARLPRLRALTLITLEKTCDFGGIRGVTGLTRLHVSVGSVSQGTIENLDFVRDMDDLQELRVDGVVRRARLDPLLGKKLVKASVRGDFGPEAERVRGAFRGNPGVHISAIRADPVRELEPQHAEAEGRPFWYLKDDLAQDFDLEDNNEVDDAVQAEIRRRATGLYSKLHFDSEASLFFLIADEEASIREAVAIIRQMIADRRER